MIGRTAADRHGLRVIDWAGGIDGGGLGGVGLGGVGGCDDPQGSDIGLRFTLFELLISYEESYKSCIVTGCDPSPGLCLGDFRAVCRVALLTSPVGLISGKTGLWCDRTLRDYV